MQYYVPGSMRKKLANFHPISIHTLATKNDIRDLMKDYTEGEKIISQPWKRLLSSFTLQNRTLITPLLFFYLQLGLAVTRTGRYDVCTPEKGFNSFVQPAVDAKKQGYENSNSSMVAHTMKL